MVMPPCGTFDYSVEVPEGLREGSDRLRAEAHTCGVGEYTGDHLRDARLVGLCPTLVASGGRFTL
jgi:hypothetical protein